MEILIKILEKSVEKNGEILLTNKHLLNIVKMCVRVEDADNDTDFLNGLAAEFDAETFGDR